MTAMDKSSATIEAAEHYRFGKILQPAGVRYRPRVGSIGIDWVAEGRDEGIPFEGPRESLDPSIYRKFSTLFKSICQVTIRYQL